MKTPGEGKSMPLEPDDLRISPEQEHLNRQLQALQRYVADLHRQREAAKAAAQSPSAPEPSPSRGWLLMTGLLVVVALVGGIFVGAVAWSDDRPAGPAGASTASPVRQPPPRPSTAAQGSNPTAAPVASLACKTAVDRANTMLAIAVRLQRTVGEYGRIITDPSSRELSGRELVDKSAPALRAGTSESAKFTEALTNYRQVMDQCEVRKP
jgi:pyruvate/2-oxoglutarate dehydrogenase complex dihydrolipoamide acyltransferase (E2) component